MKLIYGRCLLLRVSYIPFKRTKIKASPHMPLDLLWYIKTSSATLLLESAADGTLVKIVAVVRVHTNNIVFHLLSVSVYFKTKCYLSVAASFIFVWHCQEIRKTWFQFTSTCRTVYKFNQFWGLHNCNDWRFYWNIFINTSQNLTVPHANKVSFKFWSEVDDN